MARPLSDVEFRVRRWAGQTLAYAIVDLLPFESGESCAVGDSAGSVWWRVPVDYNGRNLTAVAACHATVGTGSASTIIQVRRERSGASADMLSTRLEISAGNRDSQDAAIAAVIDTSNDDVATGDQIFVDVDQVPETVAPLGLLVQLTFVEP